jgi:iron-sulfur cluster repair protein YtfE (RIC family)
VETFHHQLDLHHTGEEVALWPHLRAAATGPNDASVVDEMESEHKTVELLLAGADGCLPAEDRSGLLETTGYLSDALDSHMEHEERTALPLVERLLGEQGWKAFTRHMGKVQGLKGGSVFFPWMLEDAPETSAARVLQQLPVPVRILYRRLWQPRYARMALWDGRP